MAGWGRAAGALPRSETSPEMACEGKPVPGTSGRTGRRSAVVGVQMVARGCGQSCRGSAPSLLPPSVNLQPPTGQCDLCHQQPHPHHGPWKSPSAQFTASAALHGPTVSPYVGRLVRASGMLGLLRRWLDLSVGRREEPRQGALHPCNQTTPGTSLTRKVWYLLCASPGLGTSALEGHRV